MDIRKVHVIFKTHLDIGFTDLASSVTQNYLEHFIPAALATARLHNMKGQPKRFVWTVGAYLIDLALRTGSTALIRDLEAAIHAGDITYHALPYTLHSELCSPALLKAGLGIAARLDARFGRRTIAAKMTDVPGHTRSIIKPLTEQGIQYLHIGINDVACMPQVPPLFLWENVEGHQLLVHYERGYGGITVVPGHPEALCFLHSVDNAGPPDSRGLTQSFEHLQSQFPGAVIEASTLDAFARSLKNSRVKLPILRQEIGDTWIHGIGTDPYKTSTLRKLDMLNTQWDISGRWAGFEDPLPDGRLPRQAWLEQLLLTCEHTWGMDCKKFLTDYRNWTRDDFDAARKRDRLLDEDAHLTDYLEYFHFAKQEFDALSPRGIAWDHRSYALFERSHQEQRDYLRTAVALLPPSLQGEAAPLLEPPAILAVPQGGELPPHQQVNLAGWQAVSGAEGLMLRSPDGQELTIGFPIYQEVGLKAYEKLTGHYLKHVEHFRLWALPDNTKLGVEHSDAPLFDRLHLPREVQVRFHDGCLFVSGSYGELAHRLAGCPGRFALRCMPENGRLHITLQLLDKPANRKPETLFLPFFYSGKGALAARKIGQWQNPQDTVSGGNQRTHGMDAFRWHHPEGQGLVVHSPHAVLASISKPALLDFDGDSAQNRVYVNLYNNLWGTNFKMWYDEPISCDFQIEQIYK
ncbi:MAG: DUF5054 domain-containing protein [Clostridiales bacterium]|nr:DUF5054 domain-containing protein [Clostridiales bacterium]